MEIRTSKNAVHTVLPFILRIIGGIEECVTYFPLIGLFVILEEVFLIS